MNIWWLSAMFPLLAWKPNLAPIDAIV